MQRRMMAYRSDPFRMMIPPHPSPADDEPADASSRSAARPGNVQIHRVDLDQLPVIRRMNSTIFDEQRVINTFDREDLLMLLAWVDGEPAGFKIGYRLRAKAFYSAKGGVLPPFRRQGVARALLYAMMDRVRGWGYTMFLYDTFPNQHPGMTVLGLAEGFQVVKAGYSPQYNDYRLRFRKEL